MAHPAAALAAPRWRTLKVGNRAVELMEAGSGDPLLFLHGWGLTPRSYADALSRLCAGGVRVIAPSLPGFGGSAPVALGAGVGTYADVIARLIGALNLPKPPFVVGHSFGGGVALKLAFDHPQLVRSLTLVNTVGGRPGRGGRLAGGGFDWIRWAVGAVSELDPREWLAPHVAPQLLRDVIGNLARRPVRTGLTAVRALTASLGMEASALVESGLPVLFVWGDRDRLILPGVLADLGTQLGDLGAEIVAGRHGWMLTEPAEFAGVLRDALVIHALLERKRRGSAPITEPVKAETNLRELFPSERRHSERWHVSVPVRGAIEP